PMILRGGDCCRGALRDDRPFAAVRMEAAIPVEPARAGIPVLDAIENRKRLVAQSHCLVGIAQQPPTPGGIGITCPHRIDTVLVGQMRRVFLSQGATVLNELVEMLAGMRQFCKMHAADSDRTVRGNASPGVSAPLCPLEEFVRG